MQTKNILGLHFGHDGSAAIVKNGKLCVAISNERLSRKKKEFGVTIEMINYCLKQAVLTINDIDAVTCTDYFQKWAPEGVKVTSPNGDVIPEMNQMMQGNQINTSCKITIMGREIPFYLMSHHLAHSSAAYYTSNFDKSICLSLDACTQPIWNSLLSIAKDNTINAIEYPFFVNSVLYNNITEKLLIGDPLYKAGSTMGLASYGKILPSFNALKIEECIKLLRSETPFISGRERSSIVAEMISGLKDDEKINISQKYQKLSMDIAATTQLIFEETVLFYLKEISKKYPEYNNICLSGGSFLNCNINSRILNETNFRNVHLFPACGDDGLSVGSALFVNHLIFNHPREKYEHKEICYLGKDYDTIPFDFKRVAQAIANGKIVGYMYGRSEFGPRALGHRSILADPRSYHNRELLNFCVKKREWFRPFAPSVLAEKSSEWFIHPTESPYMLFSAQVKRPELIPAVTHVDNSARMQTVKEETNPEFYNIIKEFENITNVPMILNTSLNGDGEPVLETPEDGFRFFESKDIDMMIINGEILEK